MKQVTVTPVGRDSDKFMLRLPEGMRERIAEAAKASGRSMNAEIIARLDQSYSGAIQTDAVLASLASAIDEQKHLAEVYHLILARVGRIIEAVGHDFPTTPEAARAVQTLLILVGDRLQRDELSTVSGALREADEISSQFTMAKTKIAHSEAKSNRGTKRVTHASKPTKLPD